MADVVSRDYWSDMARWAEGDVWRQHGPAYTTDEIVELEGRWSVSAELDADPGGEPWFASARVLYPDVFDGGGW
jgi:hypothetical protein